MQCKTVSTSVPKGVHSARRSKTRFHWTRRLSADVSCLWWLKKFSNRPRRPRPSFVAFPLVKPRDAKSIWPNGMCCMPHSDHICRTHLAVSREDEAPVMQTIAPQIHGAILAKARIKSYSNYKHDNVIERNHMHILQTLQSCLRSFHW